MRFEVASYRTPLAGRDSEEFHPAMVKLREQWKFRGKHRPYVAVPPKPGRAGLPGNDTGGGQGRVGHRPHLTPFFQGHRFIGQNLPSALKAFLLARCPHGWEGNAPPPARPARTALRAGERVGLPPAPTPRARRLAGGGHGGSGNMVLGLCGGEGGGGALLGCWMGCLAGRGG